MTYSEKLKDPRWQKVRLKIFERDGWRCRGCGREENTLSVHHIRYVDGDPWDSPDEDLVSICSACHDGEKNHRHRIEEELLQTLRDVGLLCDDLWLLERDLRVIATEEKDIRRLLRAVRIEIRSKEGRDRLLKKYAEEVERCIS